MNENQSKLKVFEFLSHYVCELFLLTPAIYKIKTLTAVALQHEMEVNAQESAYPGLQERQ